MFIDTSDGHYGDVFGIDHLGVTISEMDPLLKKSYVGKRVYPPLGALQPSKRTAKYKSLNSKPEKAAGLLDASEQKHHLDHQDDHHDELEHEPAQSSPALCSFCSTSVR
jgi:hypothetical protein